MRLDPAVDNLDVSLGLYDVLHAHTDLRHALTEPSYGYQSAQSSFTASLKDCKSSTQCILCLCQRRSCFCKFLQVPLGGDFSTSVRSDVVEADIATT